jgi:SAM-dependent methyltransferase
LSFRDAQSTFRQRYLAIYSMEEALKYDSWVSALSDADHDACISDLKSCLKFVDRMSVLDAGSGTGGLSMALVRIPGLKVTALEPCTQMIDLLSAKPELSGVTIVKGFCDHAEDALLFGVETFDLIASRLLVNNLFDPLAAFSNWKSWLRPGGSIVVMDGLFDRNGWSGEWGKLVDTLPLSVCQTTATVPYLLEQIGMNVEFVGMMEHTNSMPSTRTKRYMVVATKPRGGNR